MCERDIDYADAYNWELLKVWPTMAVELSIDIGEEASLQERIIRKVNATDNMAGVKL